MKLRDEQLDGAIAIELTASGLIHHEHATTHQRRAHLRRLAMVRDRDERAKSRTSRFHVIPQRTEYPDVVRTRTGAGSMSTRPLNLSRTFSISASRLNGLRTMPADSR